MTRAKDQTIATLTDEIHPDKVYRTNLCGPLFGYAWQRCKDLIELGLLPTPMPLNVQSTVLAWTGRQVLEHRAAMQKEAQERIEAARAAPKQAQPEQFKKTKKRKLRPPAAHKRA